MTWRGELTNCATQRRTSDLSKPPYDVTAFETSTRSPSISGYTSGNELSAYARLSMKSDISTDGNEGI